MRLGVSNDGAWTSRLSSRPGRKKVAGETLYDPLRPPQPVAMMAKAAHIASPKIFRSKLTVVDYKIETDAGNI